MSLYRPRARLIDLACKQTRVVVRLHQRTRYPPAVPARHHPTSAYHTRLDRMGAPVILCGKTEKIGAGVIALLQPEYDVIHFVPTPDAGAVQIPAIFRGDQSPLSDSALGSKNYSQKPVAVILGGAYTDADTEVMMKAAAGIHPVPWLRPDASKPTPPLGPEYGKALVARLKVMLEELDRGGNMGTEAMFWY